MISTLIVRGFWGIERISCCIVNIYASNLLSEKEELWDRLLSIVAQNGDCCICIIGDFNAIKTHSERVGKGSVIPFSDLNSFDSFIRDSKLLDLLIVGRSFTCYKPDGTCKSRIDRALVNINWMNSWPLIIL